MKVSKETSAKHRDELLNAASRLSRERGFRQGGHLEDTKKVALDKAPGLVI